MATISKQFPDGGILNVDFNGQGDESVSLSADINEGLDRETNIVFSANSCTDVERTVFQLGLREKFTDNDFLLYPPYHLIPAEDSVLAKSWAYIADDDDDWVSGLRYINFYCEGGIMPMEDYSTYTYRLVVYDGDEPVSRISITKLVYKDNYFALKLASTFSTVGNYTFKVEYSNEGVWYEVPEGFLLVGEEKFPSKEGLPFTYTIDTTASENVEPLGSNLENTFNVLKGDRMCYFELTAGNDDCTVTIDDIEYTILAGQTLKTSGVGNQFIDDGRLAKIKIINYTPPSVELTFSSWCESIDWQFLSDRTTYLEGAFSNISRLKNIILRNAMPTSLRVICRYDTALETVNFKDIDVSALTDMRNMFGECSSLTSVRITVKNAEGLSLNYANIFLNASSIERIDLSSLCQIKPLQTNSTFNGCTKLKELKVSTWDFSENTNTTNMFTGCESLTTVEGELLNIKISIDLSACPLTRQSALVFINGLSSETSGLTLTLSSTTKVLLTDDDIKIATDKGWEIA